MRPHDMTQEQLLEKETLRLKTMKEKAAANVAKMEARLAQAVDPVEVERLQALVDLHKNHQKKVKALKPAVEAQKKFAALQAKTTAKLENLS